MRYEDIQRALSQNISLEIAKTIRMKEEQEKAEDRAYKGYMQKLNIRML